MGEGFENICTVSGKWNVPSVMPRLYGWVYKTLRLTPVVVEHSVVVMTAGSQSRRSQIESYEYPIFDSRFMKFLFRISGGIKLWDPSWVKTPTLAVRVQLPLGWNIYWLFNSDIVNFVWKTDEGEAESTVLLIFVLWKCFNRRWVRAGGVGQKVLFRASWNRILFRLDISTFYFY